MEILVLNGSPKGKNSVTLQTVLYLQALHPEHSFHILHAAQQLKKLERDPQPLFEAMRSADLILFSYPVYTFLAPYQLHRILELIHSSGPDLHGKPVSQITTSKHFYDMTAHRFIEENCFDLGMGVIRGLSADMDDLLTPKGREEAEMFFAQLLFSYRHQDYVTPPPKAPDREKSTYQPVLAKREPAAPGRRVVIVTNCAPEDENLANMIMDFQNALSCSSRVINLRDFPFKGGCIGCFSCAASGKCIYTDGFDTFLRQEIQSCDAVIYAFTIRQHYTDSIFKCYNDRQFCNGHRAVIQGLPTGYIISGDYRYEENLHAVIQGHAEVGGLYLCGVATDECDPAAAIQNLADALMFALENHLRRPANFYGVGGNKIFRDLIYVMRGLMKADHRFYKKTGVYDFPQKQKLRILQMKLVGALTCFPSVQKKMRGRMAGYIILPYRKIIRKAEERSTHS